MAKNFNRSKWKNFAENNKIEKKKKKKKKTVRMKFIYCCYNANTDLFKVPLIGDTCDDHEN